MTRLCIINRNARSLAPKIDSLIDCMKETDTHVAIITETWLKDGEGLQRDKEDLALGASLGLLYKNRTHNANGIAYGGVVLIWNEGMINFQEVPLKNPDKFEVLVTVGTVPGQRESLLF